MRHRLLVFWLAAVGVCVLAGWLIARADAAGPVPVLNRFHVPVVCGLPAGTPADVRAYTWSLTAGGPAQGIVLNTADCMAIADLQAHPGVAYAEDLWAVMVLSHELAHSYGVGSEDGANCIGGTWIGWVAGLLGLEPSVAAVVGRRVANWTVQSCDAWDQEGDPWAAAPIQVPAP